MLKKFNHIELFKFSFNEAISVNDKFMHYKYWLNLKLAQT